MLKATGSRVIVQKEANETMTESGLHLPDVAAQAVSIGRVLDVGPGWRTMTGELVRVQLEVGQRVVFGTGAGKVVRHESKEHVVLVEDDVIAIIQ